MADGKPGDVIFAKGTLTVDGTAVGLAREVTLSATYVRSDIEGEDRGGGIVEGLQSAWRVEVAAEFRGLDNDLSQLIPAFSAESAGKLLRRRTVVFTPTAPANPSFEVRQAVLGTDRLVMRYAAGVELVRALSWTATHQDFAEILTITPGN